MPGIENLIIIYKTNTKSTAFVLFNSLITPLFQLPFFTVPPRSRRTYIPCSYTLFFSSYPVVSFASLSFNNAPKTFSKGLRCFLRWRMLCSRIELDPLIGYVQLTSMKLLENNRSNLIFRFFFIQCSVSPFASLRPLLRRARFCCSYRFLRQRCCRQQRRRGLIEAVADSRISILLKMARHSTQSRGIGSWVPGAFFWVAYLPIV